MKKKGDPIDGVLLFDKPEGLSSNAAMQIVRRLANAQKAGHTGTLDPMATGLLPLCFGNATKYSADLLNAEKGYEARVQLGAETDSGDRTGTVTQTFDASGVTADMVREAAAAFLGEIEQIPPMHSALKKDGQCLYTLARRGEALHFGFCRRRLHHEVFGFQGHVHSRAGRRHRPPTRRRRSFDRSAPYACWLFDD